MPQKSELACSIGRTTNLLFLTAAESSIVTFIVGRIVGPTQMIIETIFGIIFVSTTRVIAKIFERRHDVLYGPYLRVETGDPAAVA